MLAAGTCCVTAITQMHHRQWCRAQFVSRCSNPEFLLSPPSQSQSQLADCYARECCGLVGDLSSWYSEPLRLQILEDFHVGIQNELRSWTLADEDHDDDNDDDRFADLL
jgi:hypothetical protein